MSKAREISRILKGCVLSMAPKGQKESDCGRAKEICRHLGRVQEVEKMFLHLFSVYGAMI